MTATDLSRTALCRTVLSRTALSRAAAAHRRPVRVRAGRRAAEEPVLPAATVAGYVRHCDR